MKKILLGCLILIPFVVHCQTRSSIGIMAGPDYSFHVYDDKNYDNGLGKFNYRFGINYNREISKCLTIEVGAIFASVGYKTELNDVRWGSEFDTLTHMWVKDPKLPHDFTDTYDYQFIEIPVSLKYLIKAGKFSSYLILGISPNIYLTTRFTETTDISSSTSSSKSDIVNKLSFAANIGFGFDYAVSNDYQVFAQPSFRYHFTKIKNIKLAEYLYSVGIEFGVRRNL